jgi:RimJ/RimL family protein N-acetyltransferase
MSTEAAPDPAKVTDGTVSLRPSHGSDVPLLIAARDEEFHKWLGPGSDRPSPTVCIVVQAEVVGWVDYDHDPEHDWLGVDEVNLGYFVFPDHRGNGYAPRAVELLLRYLQEEAVCGVASLLIDRRNEPSLAVARRCHFPFVGELNGQLYFRRSLSLTRRLAPGLS